MPDTAPKRVQAGIVALAVLAALAAGGRAGQNPPSPDEASKAALAPSRAELWKARRIEKARHLTPETPNGFQRIMLRLEQGDFLAVNFHGFYPKATSISPGSGFSPGARFWRPNILRSPWGFQASAAVSLRGYQLYDAQFGKVFKTPPEAFLQPTGPVGFETPRPGVDLDRFFLFGDVRYRNFPQEDFYGTGPDSRRQDRADFRLEDASIDLVSAYRFNRVWSAIARAGLLDSHVGAGADDRFPDVPDLHGEASAPGLEAGPDYFRFSAGLLADRRDHSGNPHSGGIVSLSYSRYQQRGGEGFDFNRYTLDAREYLPLGSRARVLALHLFASAADADNGSRVPFFLKRWLGGRDALRGFPDFRFRDDNLLLMSVEYRWEAAPALELALFGDFGKVFADRSRFDFQDLEKTYGGGVRFKTSSSVLFRVEFGRSPEGNRVALSFGPSF